LLRLAQNQLNHLAKEKEEVKQTSHPQEQAPADALFRYQVVSQVLSRQHKGEPRPETIDAVAKIVHVTVDGRQRLVSKRSIYRWIAAYEAHGFRGLLPAPRKQSVSCVLPDSLLEFIKEQKEDDPCASIPELIRRAEQLEVIPADASIDRTTVWRSLQRLGLNTRRRKYPKKLRDSRRFAYPHRMDMVLCDGKHFRAGESRAKRVALFFIDDATRMMLGVVVGTAESAILFLHGLHRIVKTHGLMTSIFLDNGAGFIAHDTINVVKNLGILCIHGTRAYPEGHGKIERFNQTVGQQCLRHLDGNPEVDPACSALTLRLSHYLSHQYNQTAHESLAKETPWSRFHNDPKKLRFVENQQTLDNAFVVHEQRHVANDNIVSIDAIHYEMPRGHAATTVVIRRNVLNNTLSFIDQGRLIQLAPVDLVNNARAGRAGNPVNADEPPQKHTRSSADIAFNRDMSTIVDADGGFTGKKGGK
jgi:transposase InsO family protein